MEFCKQKENSEFDRTHKYDRLTSFLVLLGIPKSENTRNHLQLSNFISIFTRRSHLEMKIEKIARNISFLVFSVDVANNRQT